MTQYSILNANLSNSQLNKLKSVVIKNKTEVVLRLSSNMIAVNEASFLHKLLLNNRQVSNLCKGFADKSSTVTKLIKTQISKMIQSEEFLGRFVGPLLNTGLLLMKNMIKPLAESVSVPLRLTAVTSTADTGIHNKILGSRTKKP